MIAQGARRQQAASGQRGHRLIELFQRLFRGVGPAGDDFVCPNCGCEIRLIHHGDPAKMPKMDMFTCCCGTRMEKEQRGA